MMVCPQTGDCSMKRLVTVDVATRGLNRSRRNRPRTKLKKGLKITTRAPPNAAPATQEEADAGRGGAPPGRTPSRSRSATTRAPPGWLSTAGPPTQTAASAGPRRCGASARFPPRRAWPSEAPVQGIQPPRTTPPARKQGAEEQGAEEPVAEEQGAEEQGAGARIPLRATQTSR